MRDLAILDRGGPAKDLSERLQLPVSGNPTATPLVLVAASDRLELRWTAPNTPGPVLVDFIGWLPRLSGARRQLLGKAIGVPKGVRKIIDGTAGLGRDAFVLAGLGCQVTLLERSPVLAVLLEDGLDRARRAGGQVAEIAARMEFFEADAADWLPRSDCMPDVIYLDPMFPDRGKSARAKKEMQLFRDLLGHGTDDPELVDLARRHCSRRVVVKRHPGAAPLGGPADSTVRGRLVRYDLYTPRRGG